jgi:hypothetical protein
MMRALVSLFFALSLQVALVSVGCAQVRDPVVQHREVVTLAEGPNSARRELAFSTHQGADCVLRSLRILKQLAPPPTAVVVVVGDRDTGDSYADRQPVTFSVYELRTNVTMAPGEPGIYFERTRVIRSREAYCDVEEAFRKELGLGSGAR